ncbi:MAG: patatin-like phospholipase family protein [Xenococcaceae cyanobacterium MO_188.B32]|nr:patatin-like phospholipase family protein [Xenococcaceae cyanobacterium MO_188.B32]
MGIDTTFNSIEGRKPDFFITAYDTYSRVTKWFTTGQLNTGIYATPGGQNFLRWVKEQNLWEICTASASAPTFFPPYPISLTSNDQLPHIDGGISANNPSLSVIAHVLRDRNIKLEDISMLSIGTGKTTKRFDYKTIKGWGSVQWGRNVPHIFIDPASNNGEKICKCILNSVSNKQINYLRLDFNLNKQLKGEPDFQQTREPLKKPYNEYLMKKYKKQYMEKHKKGSQENMNKWSEDEWVKELEKKIKADNGKKLNLTVTEDIDDFESCSSLKEVTELYIDYSSVRDQIREFITHNPPIN